MPNINRPPSAAEDYCRQRFVALWQSITGDKGTGEALFVFQMEDRYAEPHRKYHTWEHIQACLKVFDEFKPYALRPHLIEFALFFHDIIYEVDQSKGVDNEAASAEFANKELTTYSTSDPMYTKGGCVILGDDDLDRIMGLIMATKHDKVPKDPDEQLIADIDLVTAFGVDKSEYARQRAAIRQEYQHVPDHTFRDVRGKILMRFLERRPNIYYWKPIRDKYEELSELNLAHELGLY